MKFRVTLTDQLGNTFQTKEFAGMTESNLLLERNKTFFTVQEFFNGTVHAFGQSILVNGGREWIKTVRNTYGPDGIITILVEVDFKFRGVYETLYSGILAVGLLIETLDDDHLLQLTISQTLWWQKFLKRLESKVNIQSNGDEDGNVVVPMNFKPVKLTSQKINKSYIAYLQYNQVFQITDVTNLGFIIGFDAEILKEITQQSSLRLTLLNAADGSLTDAMDPKSYNNIVPYFNVEDDGEFTIDSLQFTMSQGPQRDSAYTGGADYVNTTNDKNTKMTNVDFYIRVNEQEPIKLIKTYRAVSNFVRNDGIVETLIVDTNDPYVTDFILEGTSFKLRKFDVVKLYGIYNDEFTFPFKIRNGLVWMWGTDGWNHNSGYDQMRGGQGNYNRWRGASSIHDDSNRGNFAYGGSFVPVGLFPDHIDNDGGFGLDIKTTQWWVIAAPGNCQGVPVTEINVLTALINMTAGSLACQDPANWNIGVLTPYEGLENYGLSSTLFQGYYDPTSGNFPATEKDGVTAIKAYDRWFISSLQTNLQGAYVDSTYIIQALFSTPGNIRAHWWISTREFYSNYSLEDLPFQGFWDASVNLYPSFEADGVSGILRDDIWIISTGGTFGGGGGVPVNALQVIRAKVNAPGQVDANWDIYTLAQWQTYIQSNLKTFNGLRVTFKTTYPDTVAQGFLLHDLGEAIIDRLTGVAGLFTSPLLGNPYTKTPFSGTGDFSLLAIFKGLQIRGYDLISKPFFISLKDYWEGLNNIACLALGKYGNTIVIKKRQDVFNPTMIIKLNWVQKIKKRDTNDEQYTSVEVGYSTWQSKSGNGGTGISSGLDDIQTKQTRNTLFKNIGRKMSILSDFIAASLNWESTRRVTNKQSANYEYDDKNFILALTGNGDGTFRPELDENFSELDNLLNSNSRYNIRLSTFRNFMRHLDYFSGCLQNNLSSFWRFASGEGNYKAATKATSNYLGDNPGVLLAENQSINPSATPLYLAQLFDIDHYLDWECYKLIRDNPDMAIGVSQTDTGHVPFFYDKLQFNYEKGTIVMTAKPKSEFDIRTILDEGGKKKYYEPAYDAHYE